MICNCYVAVAVVYVVFDDVVVDLLVELFDVEVFVVLYWSPKSMWCTSVSSMSMLHSLLSMFHSILLMYCSMPPFQRIQTLRQ